MDLKGVWDRVWSSVLEDAQAHINTPLAVDYWQQYPTLHILFDDNPDGSGTYVGRHVHPEIAERADPVYPYNGTFDLRLLPALPNDYPVVMITGNYHSDENAPLDRGAGHVGRLVYSEAYGTWIMHGISYDPNGNVSAWLLRYNHKLSAQYGVLSNSFG